MFINGFVTDSLTNEIIPYAKVKLYAKVIQSGVWSANYTKLDETTTSTSGSYSFKIDNVKASNFKFQVEKDGYYNQVNEFESDRIIKEELNSINLKMFSVAYVRFNIKNQYPISNSDIMQLQIKNNLIYDYDCCNDSNKYFEGPLINESFICKSIGNYPLYFEWIISKVNGIKSYNDTIYPIKSDTLIFNINY